MRKAFDILRAYRRLVYGAMDAVLLGLSAALVALFHSLRTVVYWDQVVLGWAICTVIIALLVQGMGTNRNLWRYAGAREYLTLMSAYLIGFVLFALLDEFVLHLRISGLLSLLAVAAALFVSIYIRALYRVIYVHLQNRAGKKKETRYLAILGAGNVAISLQEEIARNVHSPYTVWGFFDDDPNKVGTVIHGVPVRNTIRNLPEAIKFSPVYDLVLAIPSLSVERRQEIIAMCNTLKCRFQIMPDAVALLGRGTDQMEKSMRPLRIEDLLGRTSIRFEEDKLAPFVKGKTVLVTGGGGSIGSELVRQLVHAGVGRLVIFDINENDTYLLYRELKPFLRDCELLIEIGSMADERRVQDVFDRYHPDVVFHAAAHKHVPLMEFCPCEAVSNNIFGTYNLLEAARRAGCGKFVLISTDKAVNPTNIMGATKRFCENMMHAVSQEADNRTTFVAVRFGNVLGSHGSVIPLFQMQIAQGGPVTVTDKRMTRYFMTIPEAAGLVIRAGAMAQDSETYILDMGKPVKILELAENVVRLSGFDPYREIDIVETGLRPGEKLYEELLVNDDSHVATSDSKIFVERNETQITPQILEKQLLRLRAAVEQADSERLLALMRAYVPNFRKPEEVNAKRAAAEAREAETKPAREAEARPSREAEARPPRDGKPVSSAAVGGVSA